MIFDSNNTCSNVNEIKIGDALAIWTTSDHDSDTVNTAINIAAVSDITDSDDDTIIHLDNIIGDNKSIAFFQMLNGESWVWILWHLGKVNFPREGES